MIERVMAEAGLAPPQLEFVAAAIGPGGFTGIRVGLAAAHGIALAAGARLIGVTSFAAVDARIAGTSGISSAGNGARTVDCRAGRARPTGRSRGA